MPGMLPGKDYVAWEELEALLNQAGMKERDFVARFRLGLYAVREWRRKGFAPFWAAEAARLCMGKRIVQSYDDLPLEERGVFFAQLTDAEQALWEAEPAAREGIFKRVYP